MRGVKCSWKEMQRLHRDVLPALENGDGKKYAEMRCVQASTVTTWKRASDLMSVLEAEGMQISAFDNFQPSHAIELSRHFRKAQRPPWTGETKEQILDWVDRCEANELTVEDLKMELKRENGKPTQEAISCGFVACLQSLIEVGAKFPTIYADPPWQYDNRATRSAVDGHSDSAYKSTMSLDEICAEPVSQLVEDNAHLHLWTTSSFLPDAFKVIEAWGFTYKSSFVWVKPQLGIGNYWRLSHEFMLLGVRGSLRFANRGQKSWLQADRTKHSQKPHLVREMVRRVSPGPYLEMYGREPMGPPWTVYGNDVEPSILR